MKIVDRKTFLTYPSNTLFCMYEPSGNFGLLQIKTCDPGFWGNDFVTSEINGWFTECPGSNEFFEKVDMAEKGEEFRFDLDTSIRDGLYADDQLFAVYDSQDIQALIDKLKQLQK